jgi:hypothetical protein
MYRLSTTEDLSFLVHAEVIQVCIGANEAILNFDSDVRITILADFSVAAADGAAVRYDDPRQGAAALVGLLNDSIATAAATRSGDLRVAFASGAELFAFDSNSEYESFWIKGPSGEIIV